MRSTGLTVAALALLAACNGERQARIDAILALEGDATNGGEVFVANCQECHGPDGSGTETGPDVTGVIPVVEDEVIVDTVLTGPSEMPSFEEVDDQTIADVLAFLRATFGGP